MKAVVDASVAAKWVVAEEHSDRAATLLGYESLYAPAHWQPEAVNVVWSKIRALEMDAEDGRQRMEALMRSPLQSMPVPPLMGDAFAIAVENDITVYDALYLALSRQRGIPFVTADRRLLRKVTDKALQPLLLWVGHLPSGV